MFSNFFIRNFANSSRIPSKIGKDLAIVSLNLNIGSRWQGYMYKSSLIKQGQKAHKSTWQAGGREYFFNEISETYA